MRPIIWNKEFLIKSWEGGATIWLAGRKEAVATVWLYRNNYSNVEQLFDDLKDYIKNRSEYDVWCNISF